MFELFRNWIFSPLFPHCNYDQCQTGCTAWILFFNSAHIKIKCSQTHDFNRRKTASIVNGQWYILKLLFRHCWWLFRIMDHCWAKHWETSFDINVCGISELQSSQNNIFFFTRNKHARFPNPKYSLSFWPLSVHGPLNKTRALFILCPGSSRHWQCRQMKTYKLLSETRVNVCTIADHRASHRSVGASGGTHKSKPTPASCFLPQFSNIEYSCLSWKHHNQNNDCVSDETAKKTLLQNHPPFPIQKSPK